MKWVTNERKKCYYLNSSMNIFVLEPLSFKKLSHYSGMQNDILMQREGLKG